MSVAQTKSKPATKATPSSTLKAQLEASVAEAPERPAKPLAMPHRKRSSAFETESADILYELQNVFTLDLKGLSSTFWAMSQGCGHKDGAIGDKDVELALFWLGREVERKADELSALVGGVEKALRLERQSNGGAA